MIAPDMRPYLLVSKALTLSTMATLTAASTSNVIAPHPAYPPRSVSLYKTPAMSKAVQIQTPSASPPKPPTQRPALRHIRRAISRSPPVFSPPDAPLPSIPPEAQQLNMPSPRKEASLQASLTRSRSRSMNVTLPTREPVDPSYLQRARSSSPSSLSTVNSTVSPSSVSTSSGTLRGTSARRRPLPAIPVPPVSSGPSTSTSSSRVNSSKAALMGPQAASSHHRRHHSNSISSINSSHIQPQPTRSGKRQLPPIPLAAIIASLPDNPPQATIVASTSASASINRSHPLVTASSEPSTSRKRAQLELSHSASASPHRSPLSDMSSASSSSSVEQVTTPSGTIAFSVEVAGNGDAWDFSSPLVNFVHSVNGHRTTVADVPVTPDPSATSMINSGSIDMPVSLNERLELKNPSVWSEMNEIHSSLRTGSGVSMKAIISTL